MSPKIYIWCKVKYLLIQYPRNQMLSRIMLIVILRMIKYKFKKEVGIEFNSAGDTRENHCSIWVLVIIQLAFYQLVIFAA